MELLYSNIWWSDRVELLNKSFTYFEGLEFYRKDIINVNYIWDSEQNNLLIWKDAQHKFNFSPTKTRDQGEIINEISE